jgi:DNA polymerase-3 subunit gamma/tau
VVTVDQARASEPPSRPAPPKAMNGASAGHRVDAAGARRSAPPAHGERAPGTSPTPIDLAAWRAVLEGVRRQKPPLAPVLEHAIVLELGPERAVVGYPATSSFLFAQATEPTARQVVTNALRAHFGRPIELSIETVAAGQGALSIAQIASAERKARDDAARRAVVDHPLVAAAIQLLGAEIKDIRLAQDALES